MIDGKFDSSVCHMQTYYKSPEWKLNPPEFYSVPLLYKIDDRKFDMNIGGWPVTADPTRRMKLGQMINFYRNVEMHHFSYVRKDIRAKLYNSSAKTNWSNRIEEIASYYDNWTPGKKALLAGKEERYYDLVKTDNYFNINIS